jgi:hypothetical protein
VLGICSITIFSLKSKKRSRPHLYLAWVGRVLVPHFNRSFDPSANLLPINNEHKLHTWATTLDPEAFILVQFCQGFTPATLYNDPRKIVSVYSAEPVRSFGRRIVRRLETFLKSFLELVKQIRGYSCVITYISQHQGQGQQIQLQSASLPEASCRTLFQANEYDSCIFPLA